VTERLVRRGRTARRSALALGRLALAGFTAAAAADATVGLVDRDGDVGEHCESSAVRRGCACGVRWWVVWDWREMAIERFFYMPLDCPGTCDQHDCFPIMGLL